MNHINGIPTEPFLGNDLCDMLEALVSLEVIMESGWDDRAPGARSICAYEEERYFTQRSVVYRTQVVDSWSCEKL